MYRTSTYLKAVILSIGLLLLRESQAQCTLSGCTDPQADNYNGNADCDDGSCQYCSNQYFFMVYQTDFQSTVSFQVYDQQGGTLLYSITTGLFGGFSASVCTDSACPWVEVSGLGGPNAQIQVYFVGVTNDVLILTESGNACFIYGCADAGACNFNSDANADDGTCEYSSCNCPADFDDNGVVNTGDLLLLMSAFGCNVACGVFDMDSNGVVNTSDLLMFMSLFAQSCS